MPTHDTTHIPEGWRETTLGENIVEIAMGPFGSNLKVDMFTDKGVPIIKGSNLFGLYVNGDFTFVSEEKATSLGRSVAYPGDFVITHRGTLGQVALVPDNNYPRYVASQSQLRFNVDQNKIDNLYLLYFLKSSSGQYELLKNASQVGVPAIATPTKAIKDINLLLPPLPEQLTIADMLSSLDAKIELLREQNETLEKTAQTIFHEWFGRYSVESPEELPEGWRVGKVSDFVNILSGFAFKSDDFDENGKYRLVTIANVQDGSFVENTKDGLSELPSKMPDYCNLNTGDILLSLTGNVGRICHVIGENYLLNQRVAKLKAKNETDYGYTYIYFRQNGMIELLESISAGTAQQNLSPIKTAELEAVIPDRTTLDRFGEIINPMIEKILFNLLQIQSLSKTRDTLLPKLMSGEVRV